MATAAKKKKPTPAEARRDREFANRQAFELRKMRDAQRRIRQLSKAVDRATRDAEIARVECARRLVDGTPFTIVSEEWRASTEQQAETAIKRVIELEAEIARKDREFVQLAER